MQAEHETLSTSDEGLTTLGELIRTYLDDYAVRGLRSLNTARGRVQHLAAFFGRVTPAASITTAQIRQYQRARRAAGAAAASVNRETSALHRLLMLGVQQGRLQTVVGFPDRLRENPPRQGFFEHGEYTGAVDTEMQLLPAPLPAAAVFGGGPFALVEDRQARAVDDEMHRLLARDVIERDLERLAPPRERCMGRRLKIGLHHGEDRPQETLRLAQRPVEDESERQGGLDADFVSPSSKHSLVTLRGTVEKSRRDRLDAKRVDGENFKELLFKLPEAYRDIVIGSSLICNKCNYKRFESPVVICCYCGF